MILTLLDPKHLQRIKFHHKLKPRTNRVGDKHPINANGKTNISQNAKNKLKNKYA